MITDLSKAQSAVLMPVPCASQSTSTEKTPCSFLARPAAKPNRGTRRRAGIGQALEGRRYGHEDGFCRV